MVKRSFSRTEHRRSKPLLQPLRLLPLLPSPYPAAAAEVKALLVGVESKMEAPTTIQETEAMEKAAQKENNVCNSPR